MTHTMTGGGCRAGGPQRKARGPRTTREPDRWDHQPGPTPSVAERLRTAQDLNAVKNSRLSRGAPNDYWADILIKGGKMPATWDTCPPRDCQGRYPAYYLESVPAERPEALRDLKCELMRLRESARLTIRTDANDKRLPGILSNLNETRAKIARTKILCDECRAAELTYRRARHRRWEDDDLCWQIGEFERKLLHKGLQPTLATCLALFAETCFGERVADHLAILESIEELTGCRVRPDGYWLGKNAEEYWEDFYLLAEIRGDLSALAVACEPEGVEPSEFASVLGQMQVAGARIGECRLEDESEAGLIAEIEQYKATGYIE